MGAEIKELQAIEPTLKDKTTAEAVVVGAPTATEYEVESVSVGSKDKLKLKNVAGEITRSCEPVKTGGCPTGVW